MRFAIWSGQLLVSGSSLSGTAFTACVWRSATPGEPTGARRIRLQPYDYRWIRVIKKGQELLQGGRPAIALLVVKPGLREGAQICRLVRLRIRLEEGMEGKLQSDVDHTPEAIIERTRSL